MQVPNSTRYAALAVLVGALACAGNRAETDTDTGADQAAAARDTTSDTTGVQNPPGYRGMERDTTIAPAQQQPSDTFLQNQGVGGQQDTAGYSGAERVDTTGQANGQANPGAPTDTTGAAAGADSAGAVGHDTTGMKHGGMDSTGMRTEDTTGYNPSQQPKQDTTSGRY